MAKSNLTLAERFWTKVLKTQSCWIWQAQVNNKGYGCLSVYREDKGRHYPTYAHRLSWAFAHGPIPDGMYVLHHCDTPACVNPAHLFIGTQTDNMQDCWKKGRMTREILRENCRKVSDDDVRAIRLDRRPHHIIAADYGVKRNTVYLIKNLRKWSHIDGPVYRNPVGRPKAIN